MLIAIQTSTPRAYPWKLILPKEYVEVTLSNWKLGLQSTFFQP